jgi:hypothetical protein
MGGLFGGVLGLIHTVGGVTLRVLIGKAALKQSDAARTSRLIVGAAFTGFILGGLTFIIYFAHQEYPAYRDSNRYSIPFLLIPFVFFLFIILLEGVRRFIEKESP